MLAGVTADGLADGAGQHGAERSGGENQRARGTVVNSEAKQPAAEAANARRDSCIAQSAEEAAPAFVMLGQRP